MEKRIAIVGSGITGIAVADYLWRQGGGGGGVGGGESKVDFVMFEKENYVGGHARTVKVGKTVVDTGFMVFNSVTYPNMIKWFLEHGVLIEPSDMSFGISIDNGHIEWASHGLGSLFTQKCNILNVYFHSMVYDLAVFKGQVEAFLKNANENEQNQLITLGQWLTQNKYSYYFINYYIIPVCAAIWSCPSDTCLDFPAIFIFKFFKNHHLLQLTDRPQWMTVAGRSETYIKKVTDKFKDKIRLSTPVTSVTRKDGQVLVYTAASPDTPEVFDELIFACHTPDILKVLSDPTPLESSILQLFKFQQNTVVLHRDASFLPKAKSAWSSWNFMGSTKKAVTVTYWLNRLQNLGDTDGKPILVTLNPDREPNEVVDKWVTAHPIPSPQAIRELPKIQGTGHLWYSGAYLGNGFHEDGFKSGLEIAHMALGTHPTLLSNTPQMRKTWTETVSRQMVLQYLNSFIQRGTLQILEVGGSATLLGEKTDCSAFKCTLIVSNPAFYTKIALKSDLGLAAAYMDGDFHTKDLRALFQLLILNRDYMTATQGKLSQIGSSFFGTFTAYIQHKYFRNNSISNSKKNIHDHYDLGNPFFKLFLDSTMQYSCGIFLSPEDSLYQSQLNKMRHLIKKAKINHNHHVLEIGFGWGGLAIMMAQESGCKVTGITLSEEQKKYATELVEQMNLQDQIQFLLVDYRTFQSPHKFDRIVSCEMLEAVGHEYLPQFFEHTDRLLSPSGIMVVQVITMPDSRYDQYLKSTDFIQEHIFPGGCCPSLSALTSAMKQSSQFSVEHVENIGPHYAKTLALWRDNFWKSKQKILDLGFDEVFLRKWDYYFVYCEAGFMTRTLSNLQIVFSRPNNMDMGMELPF